MGSLGSRQRTADRLRMLQRLNERDGPVVVWFGNLLKNHYDGIISFPIFHITSGKVEGVNRKIDTIRRDGYGYPDDEYFFLKIIDLSRRPSSAVKHDRLLIKSNRHIPASVYSQII